MVTKSEGPALPKIFPIWPFTGRVYQPVLGEHPEALTPLSPTHTAVPLSVGRPWACQTFGQWQGHWAGPLASCQQETVDQALIDREMAVEQLLPQALWIPPHLSRGPEALPLVPLAALLSLLAWIFLLQRRCTYTQGSPCGHQSSSPCAPQPSTGSAPLSPPLLPLVSHHINPAPLPCAFAQAVPSTQEAWLPALLGASFKFQVGITWLWQIWEPAGLSCLIHAPPLSPATSNSHLPPAAASGTQRG